jgi:hypothetical protein
LRAVGDASKRRNCCVYNAKFLGCLKLTFRAYDKSADSAGALANRVG